MADTVVGSSEHMESNAFKSISSSEKTISTLSSCSQDPFEALK